MAGEASTRSRSSVAHCRVPVAALTAYTWWSSLPTNTDPVPIGGEDVPQSPVSNVYFVLGGIYAPLGRDKS